MLEDQVANLLQRYLGNYVRGLSKEALKISVWQGNVELTNMQLKPEALNALKLPIKVKAGFLGSVRLKVPWSKLGQDPVLVYLDQIFLLAEPATQVEGCSEDAVQEAKKNRVRDMETQLLEKMQQFKSEMNKSWMGSLISTIIGNLKLSISNIHIRYEDQESNPGHSFAAGISLEKLSAVTVDESGKETFVTGGSLGRIQKSVELDRLAFYLDSDTSPWYIDRAWEELLPHEWDQVFRFGTKDGNPANYPTKDHVYILQPVTGNAKYFKSRPDDYHSQALQGAEVNLEDVTLCLSKDGYRDILKLADNFAAFNQRLKYAHFRPIVSVQSSPGSWWKYACKVVSDQIKKASGKLSWEQVLKYASLRKRYISLYATLLKSDPSRIVADDNKEIKDLDRDLDIELILQWRMLAHKFVERSTESDIYSRKQKSKSSWWSFGWNSQSEKDENELFNFSEEDWEQLNKIIGYKEDDSDALVIPDVEADTLNTSIEVHMKHNASKLLDEDLACLADLSCETLVCSIKLYPETKVFDVTLGSYRLSSPNGLLAESATAFDSLSGIFCYKPFDSNVDWSLIAKASPCYVTYLKDSVDEIVNFFESNTSVSQAVALETAAAVQMTIDGVKRTAQQHVNKALKNQARFLLDLDIAAPKITVPTNFCPDNIHSTKLLLDLGNLVIRSEDNEQNSMAERNLYLQFDLVLSDVSAFLIDGDYHWSQTSLDRSTASAQLSGITFLPVIDKCAVILNLQQIRSDNPSFPSTRLGVRLPSLGFHFSPARYHRLMQVVKVFQDENSENSDGINSPWKQADFEGWLGLLGRKGVGNREAVWQRRYLCLVGPFLYVLESHIAKSYKQNISLRGKQIYRIPAELVGDVEHVLAISDVARTINKVVEDVNALILKCDSDDSRRTWQSRLQAAIYRTSGSAPITSLSESSSDTEDSETELADTYNKIDVVMMEKVFITGVLDELKVCFDYDNLSHDQSFMKVLLAAESRLFELRAIGGEVEISIRASEMFVGTILKSLEIEDLVCYNSSSGPCYVARSFIPSADAHLSSDNSGSQRFHRDNSISSEGDEKFYEAPDNLSDLLDSTTQSPGDTSTFQSSRDKFPHENISFKTPSFSRVAGLLPLNAFQPKEEGKESTDIFDSFVKAQISIVDPNSHLYNNIDMQVTMTLATLSFFCRRPTILAIMEFVNAINVDDESCESFSDSSPTPIIKPDIYGECGANDQSLKPLEEPVDILGKGKSRIVFYLTLNMARAQILLMNENETVAATLSQDNLLTAIKVFPSSFSIKAALGNLRISDDSLPSSHMYFWVCDMRNPGGSSFVELIFTSFGIADEDYEGYEYSLIGQLSEVRIIYLNRFIQEIVSYFMGLVPNDTKSIVKLKDQVTNSESWFTTNEIEGSPAVKLDLSLKKPIILMPRRTDSPDYLKLDVVHITVQNTFHWFCGSRSDINAVHLENLRILVEDINLNVGTGVELGESIIQDVNGVSLIIRRSLRDLRHQLPDIEVSIKIEELKAALSSKEYRIITECALSNISETPRSVPMLNPSYRRYSDDNIEDGINQDPIGVPPETSEKEIFTMMKVSVSLDLVELSLYAGVGRDASIATIQVTGAWLLYKSKSDGEGSLCATLKGFTVFDDRDGVEQEYRLAIGKNVGYGSIHSLTDDENQDRTNTSVRKEKEIEFVPAMLIMDAQLGMHSTSVSLCVQKPQLLVALDFLLAVVEFFVPTVGGMLSNEEDKNPMHIIDSIILDQPTYRQPLGEISLSPLRPLIVDDERFDHFVYDGRDGILYLKDRHGFVLTAPSSEAIIYLGDGKRLQLKNVTIRPGKYLDSCIFLGTNSSYSAMKDDHVYLESEDEGNLVDPGRESSNKMASQSTVANTSMELIVEFQAIGPELTFYNTSKNVGESLLLSNQLLHAQFDGFGRSESENLFPCKVYDDFRGEKIFQLGDAIEMTANALDLMMESNGIRILEPFDTSIKYSNASGKTNIHFSVSDIYMNFSFSILRLFLAVEEDILAFLRKTSKQMTTVCSEFDKVGTVRNPSSDQMYVFWRARAPPGFAVLGDYLTPLDKPPTKGVHAINTSFAKVKRPISFKLVWPPVEDKDVPNQGLSRSSSSPDAATSKEDNFSSIWFPEAPTGYIALGCVVSQGRQEPPLSSTFCVLASLVSPCYLRDCITIKSSTNQCLPTLALWRVDNSVGTFLPADPVTFGLTGKAYELRHMIFKHAQDSPKALVGSSTKAAPSGQVHSAPLESSAAANSGRRLEALASFQLIWWNRNSNSRKKISIWRPVVPEGMVYFGDVAISGYEPPNTCIVMCDAEDDELLKAPLDFLLVGHIKKHWGTESISFWMPQAPPGFVAVGCVACKGSPKQHDFSKLRCLRSDLVTGDQFLEESAWDTSDTRAATEPFSLWPVRNELGTFIVRSGFKKPPRRLALKLADSNLESGSDDTVLDADIRTFSVALFDDYGGLIVPLFNASLSGIGFSLHGRTGFLNSTLSFSLAARSYNDKYESWEPLIEPVDGFLRYQYDLCAPGAISQLRLTSTKDLNLNISVSNSNMIIQAYASWNNLNHAHERYNKREAFSPTHARKSMTDIHQKRNYFIIPQNKLGQEIFVRATGVRGLSNTFRMPAGEVMPVKVPSLKNMLDSHLNGESCRKVRTLVTVIIADGEFPRAGGLSSNQYTAAIRLAPDQSLLRDPLLHQQSARTCGSTSGDSSSKLEWIKWNEVFFFKIDKPESYVVEWIVSDVGKGEAVGFFSAPLDQMAGNIQNNIALYDYPSNLTWIDLSSAKSMSAIQGNQFSKSGRLRCSILLSPASEVDRNEFIHGQKSGFIQISPSMEGPWTTVRLNYAAPAACWRLGNDVVASAVSLEDGNRCVTIRSLVSVRNNTDFILDLRLVPKASNVNQKSLDDSGKPEHADENIIQTDVFFETEKYNPSVGWVGASVQSSHTPLEGRGPYEPMFDVELPTGWELTNDWQLDTSSVNTEDGWVYAPDKESLKWPSSFDPLKSVNHARQRKWIRNRRRAWINETDEMSVGVLNPGDVLPLPLAGLTQSGPYVLQMRPSNIGGIEEYSWSFMVDKPSQSGDNNLKPGGYSGLCVSCLTESVELLYCTQMSSTSSSNGQKLWYSVTIQTTEIAKDAHSDPIHDWNLVVKSPFSITNYLPLAAEFSVLEMQESGHFVACSRGILYPGKTVKVYEADIRNPLFFSLLPQIGWLPIHEAVLISHPQKVPSKTINLRSSISGRIVQLIVEQNHDKEQPLQAKIIRVYAPYWLDIARCPPLTFRFLATAGKKPARKNVFSLQSKKNNEAIFEEITEEEIYEGHTIASTLNFNLLSLSVSINQSGAERFGPAKDLSSLGDMDGSLDLYAYGADGNCLRLCISTKPSPYQSVPTKVISVRPFMTFTNRLGKDIYVKLNNQDQPKVLRPSDTRISFVHREAAGTDTLQVQLEHSEWSYPVQITKEDTIFLVLRRDDGTMIFVRTEVRGYEEGSRFIVVFRLGSASRLMRIENRTVDKTISIRQSGFSDKSWSTLYPLSTMNFSWEDPYGQKYIDAKIVCGLITQVLQLDLESTVLRSLGELELGVSFQVMEIGRNKIGRFSDYSILGSGSSGLGKSLVSDGNWAGSSYMKTEMQTNTTPLELIVELGVLGVSLVDIKPKELAYLYLERLFISYSTGYDAGKTSRFKLILGHMQLDNQLPLTVMPVLLGPEQTTDIHHPVFKMTITSCNENTDGINVYPYVYIRVSEKRWRLNVHEPIIWALVDLYNNLQLDHLPHSSNATQVDPEIRIDLIDVSEVRMKLSLETALGQRPRGVLGVWSPLLSAIGNAFKIQVHLRRVMQRDRFMRRSSIGHAIGNRIWRDLVHNPLHLIFSVDVLGMTSSTLASLSKGFAELSTDGQFLQLRSKQVWSRRITGVGDGIIQGTEALAQGVAFGLSGVVTKPMESARQNGLLGLAHGIGRAFIGFIVQPVSGALDFFSLTVDGIGASCSKCLEVLNNKTTFQRIRNPRAIHADGILREYCEKEALGQMILHLAEASRHFGCTEIFKEPSKFALSDYYEEYFMVPYQRIVLVTNKRVMLLQCPTPEKPDKKPCKIMWDVPWEQLMAIELAKAGCLHPSHLLLHLKSFKRSENFVRIIKCKVEEPVQGREAQAVQICAVVYKMWRSYQSATRSLILKVPSSQRHAHFAWSEADGSEQRTSRKKIIRSRELSFSSGPDESRFVKHGITFSKIWSSERESKSRCTLCKKQISGDDGICSIWRPICPEGYVSIGDIARAGNHPPNVAAVYRYIDKLFTAPLGYDLVWRNCSDDYTAPLSIWLPRAPEGYVSVGCVVVADFEEPESKLVYCVAESLVEETQFEEERVWCAGDSYPWACYFYQVKSDALHFVALRQVKEESEWKPMRIRDDDHYKHFDLAQ